MAKEEIRKIDKKNYIIFVIVVVLSLLVISYLTFWYKKNEQYSNTHSVMNGYLLEIGEDEVVDNLSNYVLDNPNFVLYIAPSDDKSIKAFEQEFKNFITTENIKNDIVYIDLNMIKSKQIVSEIGRTFFTEELKSNKLNNYPNLLIFEGGKISSVMYASKTNPTLSDAKFFLRRNGVVNND